MANKSDKDFGKRKPVSVPASPRPGPPAKRSGHVALLLMGTFAVGSAAYALMPSQQLRAVHPNAASPSLQQNNRQLPAALVILQQRRLRRQLVLAQQLLQQRFLLEPFILGHFQFRLARRAARRLRLVRRTPSASPAADISCSASPAPNATTGVPPPKAPDSTFHTIDGERYWDERAYYAFTLDEIERRIEAPTGEIDAMCLELVGHAINDEKYLRRLKIPEAFWPLLSESWRRRDASLYGRLDLSYDGWSPAKLLEYNADTPTSIFEAAVFQWTWLEQAIERNIIPKRADQFNSIHERLIDAWKKHRRREASASRRDDRQYRGCRHAGLSAGHREPGRIADHADGYQGRRTRAAMAASSISTTVASSSPSSSTPGNGCLKTRSARSSQARRHAGSSRPGKRSFPTRVFFPCYGRCFRTTPICCRPISRTIRTRPGSAPRSCASRFIRAKARTSHSSAPAPR